jgi:hypothetical protein
MKSSMIRMMIYRDLPMKNGGLPVCYLELPEANS